MGMSSDPNKVPPRPQSHGFPGPPRGTRKITRPFRLEDMPRSKPLPDPMDQYNEEIEMMLGCSTTDNSTQNSNEVGDAGCD